MLQSRKLIRKNQSKKKGGDRYPELKLTFDILKSILMEAKESTNSKWN